jgi:hypothetical protein
MYIRSAMWCLRANLYPDNLVLPTASGLPTSPTPTFGISSQKFSLLSWYGVPPTSGYVMYVIYRAASNLIGSRRFFLDASRVVYNASLPLILSYEVFTGFAHGVSVFVHVVGTYQDGNYRVSGSQKFDVVLTTP